MKKAAAAAATTNNSGSEMRILGMNPNRKKIKWITTRTAVKTSTPNNQLSIRNYLGWCDRVSIPHLLLLYTYFLFFLLSGCDFVFVFIFSFSVSFCCIHAISVVVDLDFFFSFHKRLTIMNVTHRSIRIQ